MPGYRNASSFRPRFHTLLLLLPDVRSNRTNALGIMQAAQDMLTPPYEIDIPFVPKSGALRDRLNCSLATTASFAVQLVARTAYRTSVGSSIRHHTWA